MKKYQQSLSSSFGAEVGAKRKNKKLTQKGLAELAGVSIPSIRQFENARGQLGTAKKIIAALGLLWGWPPSATDEPGRSLAELRIQIGLSQRAMALKIQVSQPTIVAIEKRFSGTLPVLLAYLAAVESTNVLRDPRVRGRTLVPKRNASEADIVMTTSALARRVIATFTPEMNGVVLEPARGDGAFFDQLPRHIEPDWCEIAMGRDFFGYTRKVDWIITNPPYSQFKEFLFHALDVADNIVFLCPLIHFGTKHRLRQIGAEGFGFKRVILTPQPREWTSAGFQVAATHLQRGWAGKCTLERL
jgi:transcriptional regulator with XRE-family HTH domain